MSRSDIIADSLTIIRNAVQRKKQTAEIPYSNILENIITNLKDEGFISNYRKIGDVSNSKLRVYLRYNSEGNNFITGIKRVSKPGRRIYKKATDIPEVLNGLGVSIVTTPKGVMTGENAKKLGVGGELICYIW